MVAGRGIAQLITEGSIVTFNDPALIYIGTGSFLGLPMPTLIALVLAIQGLSDGNFADFIARVDACLTTATCV